MKPFVKWVGSKRQLLDELLQRMPTTYDNYFEPFIGSGALFFNQMPKKAVINDYNRDLVLAYRMIFDHVDELIYKLKFCEQHNCKEFYYNLRACDRDGRMKLLSDVERAARVLYMLRVDFNGLYRVNSRGQFNVPYGRYKYPNIVNEDALREASDYFKRNQITIMQGDFVRACASAKRGDFVYLDPSYAPVNETSNFTAYTDVGFSDDDQKRVRDLFVDLDQRGVNVMLSNADVPLIRSLYQAYAKTTSVIGATRMLNSKSNKRGKVAEVVITNY